jgi:hypothetical protein
MINNQYGQNMYQIGQNNQFSPFHQPVNNFTVNPNNFVPYNNNNTQQPNVSKNESSLEFEE